MDGFVRLLTYQTGPATIFIQTHTIYNLEDSSTLAIRESDPRILPYMANRTMEGNELAHSHTSAKGFWHSSSAQRVVKCNLECLFALGLVVLHESYEVRRSCEGWAILFA